MTAGGGWPELDEDALAARAIGLMAVLRQVTSVTEVWLHEEPELFSPSAWSGSAAVAASGKVAGLVASLHDQQISLATAILWYRFVSSTVNSTKSGIAELVSLAQWLIAEIEATAAINPDADSQIREIVSAAKSMNQSVVSDAAAAIAVADFKPSPGGIEQLLNQVAVSITPVPSPASSSRPSATANTVQKALPNRQTLGSRSGSRFFAGDRDKTVGKVVSPSSSPATVTDRGSPPPDGHGNKFARDTEAPTDKRGSPTPAESNQASGTNTIARENALSPEKVAAPQSVPPDSVSGHPSNSVLIGPETASNTTASPSAPAPSLGSPSSGGGSSSGSGSSSGGSALSGISSGSGSSPGSGQSQSGASPASAGSGGSPAGQGSGQSGQGPGGQQGAQSGAGPSSAPAPVSAPAAASAAAAAAAPPPATAAPPPAAVPSAGAPTAPGSGVSAPALPGVGPAGTPGTAPAAAGIGGMGPGLASAPSTGVGAAPAVPLGPPPTPAPAAPVAGPAGAPISTAPVTPTAAGTPVAAPIPVSAARAEREAIAAAMSAEAGRGRRRGAAGDPVSVAIRIAAALNAEDRPDGSVYDFFWTTAVTTEGQIIVANSYGLGYIPAGQNLPDDVCLVSLDASVPLEHRVSWATHPWAALLGWAQAKGVGLRTIIGTEAQLAGTDLGVHSHVLQADDIPPTSFMSGRDRLAMIAPDHARQLAATADGGLTALLPPAPADAIAPEDRTDELWFSVMTPMMSKADGRHIAQLEALLAYADHCEELAIHKGHNATDPSVQRAAIADGLYWHHLARLTDDALTSVSRDTVSR